MGKLLNVTQLAEKLGVSRVTVTNAIKSSVLPVAKREKSGPKIDEDVALRVWADREAYSQIQSRHRAGGSRGGRPKKNGEPAAMSPEDPDESAAITFEAGEVDLSDLAVKAPPERRILRANAAQAEIKAYRANLDLRKRRGELVEVAEVRAKGAELGTILMGALTALPDRLAQQLATMDDPEGVHALLVGEIDAVLINVRQLCGMNDGDPAGSAENEVSE